MAEVGQPENPSPIERAKVIENLKGIKDSESFSHSKDAMGFAGKICTENNLAKIVDPEKFQVPLTDIISVRVREVEIMELKGKGVLKKRVTVPTFRFDDKKRAVSVRVGEHDYVDYEAECCRLGKRSKYDGYANTHTSGSRRPIDNLYAPDEGWRYQNMGSYYENVLRDKAWEEYSRIWGPITNYDPHVYSTDYTIGGQRRTDWDGVRKMLDEAMSGLTSLSKKEIAERFLKAIDPNAVVKEAQPEEAVQPEETIPVVSTVETPEALSVGSKQRRGVWPFRKK